MSAPTEITIPMPTVAPVGWAIDDPQMIQDVWDVFVKPEQDAGMPQSIEMRKLMAILRAVFHGLSATTAEAAS